MKEMLAEAPPRLSARLAGFVYLLVFLTGGVAVFFSGGIVVSGDAAATVTNILAHKQFFHLGFAANLIVVACYIAVTALFYELFEPVNGSVSLVAAFFSLVGCGIQAFACLFYLAPSVATGAAPYLTVFKVEQLQALPLMFLNLYGQAYNIGLVLFGFLCFLIGWLIFRSTFLPRAIGVLMLFAGLGWLAFLSPPLANYLRPYILLPGILGEGSLTLWLLVKGVNVQRWKVQASAGRMRT